jgi:hypothetical protein
LIEDFLLKGEEVVLNIGDYYATGFRLIKYDKHFGTEEFSDVPYSNISSIRTGSKNNRGLGASLIAFGVLFVYLSFLDFFANFPLFQPILVIMAFASWIFGAILLVVNFSYYELEVDGGHNWRIKRLKSGKTRELMRVIRQNLLKTGKTSRPKTRGRSKSRKERSSDRAKGRS